MISRCIATAVLTGTLCAVAVAEGPAQYQPVALGKVRVGGEMGRRIDANIDNNLLKMDVDKDFLDSFVRNENPYQTGFLGTGHTIDTAVSAAAYTRGDPRVMKLKQHVVDTIVNSQHDNGYIGYLPRLWDIYAAHELAYIIQALCHEYDHFGNRAALDAAKRAGDFYIEQWRNDRPESIVPHLIQNGGIEDAYLDLYRATGDRKYFEFAAGDDGLAMASWSPKLQDHAYGWMSACKAAAGVYRVTNDPSRLAQLDRTMDFMLEEDGMLVTGGIGINEFWHNTQEVAGNASESCAVAYTVRFLDVMMQVRGDSLYGDVMERVIYNALFSAQSPDGRRFRYYTPAEGPRVYHSTDWYCCPGNMRRILAELPKFIYYTPTDGAGIVVNLYTASQGAFDVGGGVTARVRQTTEYPYDGRVTIEIACDQPARFPVKLRIPRWCGDGVTLSVNGRKVDVKPGRYVTLDRAWGASDTISLELPMAWRLVEGRKAQAGRLAVMRGPLLFGFNPDVNPDAMKYVDSQVLHQMTLDPALLGEPVRVESDGHSFLAVKTEAWRPGWTNGPRIDEPAWFYAGFTPKVPVTLTEYADPGNRAIYFKAFAEDGVASVADELIKP